ATATAIRYAETTQARRSTPCRSAAIMGRATATMVCSKAPSIIASITPMMTRRISVWLKAGVLSEITDAFDILLHGIGLRPGLTGFAKRTQQASQAVMVKFVHQCQ